LADASSDAEWAQRAPNTAPSDLSRLARTVEKPTMDEARARRGADALVQLCRDCADEHAVATPNVVMVVEVPQHGPVTVAGIPLPDEMVQSLRAQAKIDPVLVDEQRVPIAVGKARSPLSAKTLRAVRLRDGHCRGPGVIGGRGCRCITCGR
jgi:hypothetical protein